MRTSLRAPPSDSNMALKRLNALLRYGVRLHLMDVTFVQGCEANIDVWIAEMGHDAGPMLEEEVSRHVRKEYSTFAWILEGLLERAGFRIDNRDHTDGVLARYFCTKVGSVAT